MPTTTTNYSFNKPTVGGDEDAWGGYLNGNWDTLDTLLGGVTNAELSILDGATVTTAELNTLDGITATVTELNYNDITTLGTVEASKVVTADANGDVTFPDNEKAIFGAGSDLEVFHDGTKSVIQDIGTGSLQIKATDLEIRSATTDENYIYCVENGSVTLYYNDSAKIATTSVGADVTGELIADSYNETYAAVTSSSNATTVDCEAGNAFSHTLTENTTFTFSNPPASGTASCSTPATAGQTGTGSPRVRHWGKLWRLRKNYWKLPRDPLAVALWT